MYKRQLLRVFTVREKVEEVDGLSNASHQFTTFFPLGAAVNREIVRIVCNLPIRDEFERSIGELNNTKYAGILDWRKVIETLSLQDTLVLPTFYHSEGHPGVLIEAMMAGIAIISTNFRSIPEIVAHEQNGLLVSPSSVPELTKAIERLAYDRDLLLQLARNNSAKSKNFTAETLVNKIITIASNQVEPSSQN